jgi:hypothetical protein
MVVERGNVQQYLYHLHDGPEQQERDRKMQVVPTPEGEALAWRDPGLAPKLLGYDHIADVCFSSQSTEKLLTSIGQRPLGRVRGSFSSVQIVVCNSHKMEAFLSTSLHLCLSATPILDTIGVTMWGDYT